MPPPGTIPSDIAARAAASEPSLRRRRSFVSTAVAPPTRITASFDDSRARRSRSESMSCSFVARSSSTRISFIRPSTASAVPAPSMNVV